MFSLNFFINFKPKVAETKLYENNIHYIDMNSTRNKDMIFLFTPSPPLKNYLADVLFILFLNDILRRNICMGYP